MTASPLPTLAQVEALLPDPAVEANRRGELVIYTGLRVDPADPTGPLIEFECPTCDDEDLDDPDDCDDPWHLPTGLGG